ncbi:MAG: hypothetical protein HGB36_11910 [Chlorobiaceae bacterium]|nr:hypothetical protein [Chlorobiaceae bacterium]
MKKNMLLAAGIAALVLGNKPVDANATHLMVAMGTRGVPEIVVGVRPDFIFLPDTGFFVSWGSPYDMIFFDNMYYLYSDGLWYNAWYYDGPWSHVPDYDLPPVIRRYHWPDLRRFRDTEYRRYERGYWDNRFRQDRERFTGHPRNMPGFPPPPGHAPSGWNQGPGNGYNGFPPPPHQQGGNGWQNGPSGKNGHSPGFNGSPGGYHPDGGHNDGSRESGHHDDGPPHSDGNHGGPGGPWPNNR